jgi:hypothetical protein
MKRGVAQGHSLRLSGYQRRHGAAFLGIEPLRGWRRLNLTDRRRGSGDTSFFARSGFEGAPPPDRAASNPPPGSGITEADRRRAGAHGRS